MGTQTEADLMSALSEPSAPHRRRSLPRLQELGLIVVILVIGLVLAAYGVYDAHGGKNTFLNLDNLVGQIATYMAVYAIMAVGVTCVIITGGIDISVGSILRAFRAGMRRRVAEFATQKRRRGKSCRSRLLAGPGVGLLCGLVNGILITVTAAASVHRHARHAEHLIAASPTSRRRSRLCRRRARRFPTSFTTNFIQKYFFEKEPGVGGVS